MLDGIKRLGAYIAAGAAIVLVTLAAVWGYMRGQKKTEARLSGRVREAAEHATQIEVDKINSDAGLSEHDRTLHLAEIVRRSAERRRSGDTD